MTIFSNIFSSVLWVVCYTAGAYTTSAYKWESFAFGTLANAILAMSTLDESRDYLLLAVIVNVPRLLYTVA